MDEARASGGLASLLGAVLNVRPGEGRVLALLLGHSFFLGVASSFFETTASALFLANYGASDLPRAYVIAAAVTGCTGFVYTRLERRLPVGRLLVLTLVFLGLSVALLRGGLVWVGGKWPSFVLLVWAQCLPVLLGMEFWGLATNLLDVRQGKRLFGVLGSGEVVAGILCGALVPWLVARVGAPNLLWFSALGVAACGGLLTVILRGYPLRGQQDEDEEGEEPEASPWANRYVWGVLLLSCVALVAFYKVEFAFLSTVEGRLSDADALAAFLGKVSAAAGGVTLAFRLLLSGRLLGRFGLVLGLSIVPFAAGLMTLLTAGFELWGAASWVFGAIVATKLIDDVLRSSMFEPSVKILYQPLPTSQRVRVLAGIEGVIEPMASGVSGLLLGLMTGVLGLSLSTIRMLLFVEVFLWVFAAVWVQRRYVGELTLALNKRSRAAALSLDDRLSVGVLTQGLSSPLEVEAIRSLLLLEEERHPSLAGAQRQLSRHRSARVRREALDSAARTGSGATLGELTALIERDDSREVRAAAVRALCALNTPEAIEQARVFLEHGDPALRGAALVGLLRSGGIVGVLAAGQTLTALERSRVAADRRLVAEVLGEVSISSFYQPLVAFLGDPDPGVRRAALASAARVNNPRLYPGIIDNLADARVRVEASAALSRIGEEALPALTAAFSGAASPRVLQSVVRVVARMKGEAAGGWLVARLDYPDEPVRLRLLAGLARRHFQAEERTRELVEDLLRREIADASWTLSAKRDVGVDAGSTTLQLALDREVDLNVERAFFLLSFLYTSQVVLKARENFRGPSPELRAYAIEVLDNVLSQEHKSLFFPLLDDLPDAQRKQRLESFFPDEPRGRSARLVELVSRPRGWAGPWLRACAAHLIGVQLLREGVDALTAALGSPDELVRETSIWALARLAAPGLPELLQRAYEDPSPRVVAVARASALAAASSSRWSRAIANASPDDTRVFAGILLDPREPRKRRVGAASALRRGDPEVASEALLAAIELPDEAVRSAALSALCRAEFSAPAPAIERVCRLLEGELDDALKTSVIAAAVAAEPGAETLLLALDDELRLNRERCCSCLAALGARGHLDALLYFFAGRQRRPATDGALVRLDAALAPLPAPLALRCRALLLEADAPSLLSRLGPAEPRGLDDALIELLSASSAWVRPWTRVCALDLLVARGVARARDHLSLCLRDPDDLVRSAAREASLRLPPPSPSPAR